MTRSILYRGIFLCFLLLCAAHFGFAQNDTARLQGTITDANGGAVNGASITVKNIETGRTTPTSTNELGYYTVPALPPGHYRVEITQKGFKKEVRELELQVAQVGVADFQLQIGDISQSIVVEAGSPVINPADSAIGDVVESRQITELPLNGRNFTQLATLIPGVTRGVLNGSATGSGNNTETFRNGETGGASLAVNGLRPQNNNFTLDGIDNNESLVNTIIFFPPADAIDEFRVQTSVAPAEIGRAGGAVIITSTKSGTNSWHGSAFEFNRTTSLQSRDFFDSGPTPDYNRNQFGGTVGGPIIKNKLFVFGDYQGLRKQVPGSNDVASVPTDLMRKGNFSELLNLPCGAGTTGGPTPSGETPPTDINNSKITVCQNPGVTNFSILVYDPMTAGSQPVTRINPNGETPFAGNIIPTGRLNTVGMAYINAFPEPNCTAAMDSRCHVLLQNYHNVRHIIENWNDFDVRTDYILNQHNSIFGRFSRGRADQTETTRLTTLPSGFGSGTNFNHPYGASIGWTDTINPSVVNEARVGFVRTYFGNEPPFSGTNICTNLGIVNCNTPLLGGIALIGGFNNQIEFTGDFGSYLIPQTGYNYNDTVSWSKGKHTFKFGANFIRRQLNLYRPLAGKGFFALAGNGVNGSHFDTGYEVSDLLAGFVDSYSHGPNIGRVGTRSWENGLFVEDDWRITPRLTFNLGLRYDILTWPVEVQDRQANFNLVTGALDLANQGNSRALINNNYNNFGPRLGFAYQLTNDGKTVVRGGFGIFYFLDRGGISNQLAQNPPFAGENTVTDTQGFRITLSGSLPCEPACTPAQLDATMATGPVPTGNFVGLNLAAPTGVSVVAYLPNNATPRVTQYNLQVQREVGVNSSLSLAYVGTVGRFLTRNYNENQQLFGVPTSSPNHDLFPALGNVTVEDNHGNSSYNSLQAQYERRLTKGLQFLGAFTWSKTIDDACGLDNCSPQLFSNFSIERARSNIDQPYRLVLSSLYELPFGRGKRFGTNWSRAVDWAVGGWQLNGIYTLQAGLPFSVTVDGNPGSTRADLIGTPSVDPGNLAHYINIKPVAFSVPASTGGVFNAPGTSGRDILRGPGSSNMDLAIFKNLQISERIRTELRLQAYNLTNTPHFANPNSDFSQGNFGQITGTQPFSYRQVELGLRITF
jgi:hypothetical protein